VTSGITAVARAHVIGGRRLGDHRATVAGISYGIFCSGLWALVGFLAGDALRAL